MTQEQLDELAKIERKTYFKEWRAANPEKTKQHRENYWRKRAAQKLTEEGESVEDANNSGRG